MTATAAAASTTVRLRRWLSVRHSLGLEAALVLSLYGVYELARGLVVGNTTKADRHAEQLVAVERSLHLFVEGRVQHAVDALPGLAGLLGIAYLTLHLAVTAVVLLWLNRRRPAAFPFVRTTLLVASALALVGFLAYPAAPPRLAGIGIADTVSSGHVDLNHGLVSSLYNPYAAVPSMHVGYALIVASACSGTEEDGLFARSGCSTRRSCCSWSSPPATTSSSTPPPVRSSPHWPLPLRLS